MNSQEPSATNTLPMEGLCSLAPQLSKMLEVFMNSSVNRNSIQWNDFANCLLEIRRGLHQYPETGYHEFQTQAFIRSYCENILHIPSNNIRIMASTGLCVDLYYGNQEVHDNDVENEHLPVLAFRAEIDALPMEESNTHLSYCSKHRSNLLKQEQKDGEHIVTGNSPTITAAHMCGHDGHITIVLGLMTLLVREAYRLPASKLKFIRFFFQPAEEGPGGAKQLIRDGVLRDVDEVYGLHNYPFPLYEIRVKSGPVMAHDITFFIDIHGTGGHGSAPQLCIDPILIGATIVQSLQSIVSRNIPPTEPCVVSVCKFHGGEAESVVPSSASLSGTIRCYNLNIGAQVKILIPKIVDGTCASMGATATVRFKDGYAPVINNDEGSLLVKQVAQDMGIGASEAGLPLMAAEDFSYYLHERNGCFFFLGTEDPTPDQTSNITRGLHSNTFDFNDKATCIGLRIFLGLVQTKLKVSLFSLQDMKDLQLAMESSLQK